MDRSSPRLGAALLAALAIAVPAPAQPPPAAAAAAPMLGFDAAGAAAQRELERALDERVSRDEMRDWMRRMTSRPHHLGSSWGRANAEWMRDQLESWGLEARIETFRVLFPTPRERRLELTAPARFVARLEEPALAEDATSGQKDEQLPTYNAYSADGDVEGELVYVNYGLPADYEELAQRGVEVRGKVVLARYGGSWRGIKPKVAAEHGAIGCIIYSDPAGDGWFAGDVYPKGGWRSPEAVQRGSVADMPIHAGDPLTPGVGATEGAARLPLSEVRILTRIPTLPISAADAEPLLRALGGPMAPESWRGGLPLPYRLGAGPARVRLRVAFDWRQVELHDVVATLPGADLPDEWVIHGNHHDAWVNGATDPVSGMVALLAEAKAIGELARERGWRPRRTLVWAAWDGEEPGLLGSTEWAEAHGEELRRKAVVYLNTDSLSRGHFSPAGSHSLERFVHEAAAEVIDPEVGVPVGERSRAARIAQAKPEDRAKLRARLDYRIDALGSGSDYTPFLQHLGIASLNVDFGGQDQYGQYHSIYDSFDHFTRFMDPGFDYLATSAKLTARIVTRLAGAEVVPLTLDRTAEAVADYVVEVRQLADRLRGEAEERERLLAERSLLLAADPRQTFVPPPALDRVPHLELAPLDNSSALFTASANAFESARAAAVERRLAPALRAELNAFLRGFERRLTLEQGLPERPWYRHQLYAPGLYTGYGVKTLPAVREAIELRRWSEADAQIRVVAALLDEARAAIDAMTAKLVAAGG
jgi:N-acetylated-alpha-linked acidic dipeptidase